MEKLKNIDDLIVQHINLKKLGFQHLDYMMECNTGTFYRETKDKYDVLTYGFGYDYRLYDPITMSKEGGMRSYISFKSVEKILNTILPDPHVSEIFSDSWNFIFYCQQTLTNKMIPNINSPDELTHEIAYQNGQLLDRNILEAVNNMNIYIQQYHLPFFNYFLTIKDVNDKILEKYDWMDWNEYFLKNCIFKAIIIMKLCRNNTKYDEFTKMYKSRIYNAIQQGENDNSYLVPHYESFLKVMDYLESGKYKELMI